MDEQKQTNLLQVNIVTLVQLTRYFMPGMIKRHYGKISDIQIDDNKETPDLGGKAIAELPAEMIKGQTYEIDAMSGATITSNGMKDAVARCLEQASNQPVLHRF